MVRLSALRLSLRSRAAEGVEILATQGLRVAVHAADADYWSEGCGPPILPGVC